MCDIMPWKSPIVIRYWPFLCSWVK